MTPRRYRAQIEFTGEQVQTLWWALEQLTASFSQHTVTARAMRREVASCLRVLAPAREQYDAWKQSQLTRASQ